MLLLVVVRMAVLVLLLQTLRGETPRLPHKRRRWRSRPRQKDSNFMFI
jgi:uncharacterized protein HemY